MRQANAVLKGGGVKGIALTGALAVAEEQGWTWQSVAGTSAGAITAALLAAGYTAPEVHTIINDLDFNDFKERGSIIPGMSVIRKEGMYKGDYVIALMDRLLGQKLGKAAVTFRDLPVQLRVVSTDLTHKRELVFPDDLAGAPYNLPDPQSFLVSHAVRASMSIPLFFEPYELTLPSGEKATLVDGGMLSNYPIGLFNPGQGVTAQVPTFGLFLQAPADGPTEPTGSLSEFLHALVTTTLEGRDNRDLQDQSYARSIFIDTGVYTTTEFDIDQAGKDWLYQSGRKAATAFLADPAVQEWLQQFEKVTR